MMGFNYYTIYIVILYAKIYLLKVNPIGVKEVLWDVRYKIVKDLL